MKLCNLRRAYREILLVFMGYLIIATIMFLTIKQRLRRARLRLRSTKDSIRIARLENRKSRRPLTPSSPGSKLGWRRQKYYLQDQSPLFKLPLELRREIYNHIYGRTVICFFGQRESGHRFALLKTCRKIYVEAIEIFYNCDSLAYHTKNGTLYTLRCKHPTRKANFHFLHIHVEFSLLCCQYCDRLDLFEDLSWEQLARWLLADMPLVRHISVTMINMSPQIAFHRSDLDGHYFADLLTRLVVPQWHNLGFLENFEVEVNWEMERPQEPAVTAFRVLKD